jgi:hypothetical protein
VSRVTEAAAFFFNCSPAHARTHTHTHTNDHRYTNAYNRVNLDDDIDDDVPSMAASLAFQNARDAYDNLVRDMLVVWDGVVGVAVGLWIVLRSFHQNALDHLHAETRFAATVAHHDEWRLTRWRAWNEHFRLLKSRGEAFDEVAKPLEPYIFVFALFAAPAFVMSTPFCQDRSGASTVGTDGGNYAGDGTTNFTYVITHLLIVSPLSLTQIHSDTTPLYVSQASFTL